jgi:phospholipid/cholesterol/gamma-HCH transport system substrate-binding protein
MKKTAGNKIRLGIFVTISIALFTLGIYFIGERQQLFNNTFHVSGIFKNISGLQIGNNVRFSGINVGIIDEIEQITDSTVRVDMMIDEDAQKFIKKNAKATIGSDGLMGNKIVLITPGAVGKQSLSDKDMIETFQPVTVDDILIKLKVTSDNAATITSDLSIIIASVREGKGTIGKLMMDTVLAKNVDQALVNIKHGAGGFNQNMNAASHNILLKGYFKNKKNKKDDDSTKDEKDKK